MITLARIIKRDTKFENSQCDQMGPRRNRNQIPGAHREELGGKSWKKGRDLVYFGVVLSVSFFGVSSFSHSLKFAKGFRVHEIEGWAKQRQNQQTLLKLRLNVVPLRTAGDEVSSEGSVSSSEGNEIVTIDGNITTNETIADSNSNSSLLLNFNASGSIGSLLMQMQRKEAELRLLNKSTSLLLNEEQALKFDATNYKTASTSSQKNDFFSWIRNADTCDKNPVDEASTDDDIAKELDNFVSIRITNSVKDITILGPPEISRIKPRTGIVESITSNEDGERDSFGVQKKVPTRKEEEDGMKMTSRYTSDSNISKDTLPSLSKSEHYNGCIGRDMRHLAVSIAACISGVEEWQLFCQQSTGGLEPLIECIREGAESMREGSSPSSDGRHLISSTGSTYRSGLTRNAEKFQVASSACRVLRDLCAISQDLAAVTTDGILRANTADKNAVHTLMDDMCTILHQADYFSDVHGQMTDDTAPKRKLRFLRRRKNQASSTSNNSPPLQSKKSSTRPLRMFLGRRAAGLQFKLYVTQLLLAMTCASDSAVDAIRSTEGLKEVLLIHSSYARKERRRRWMRYPFEKLKSIWLAKRKIKRKFSSNSKSFATQNSKKQRSLQNDLNGKLQGTANQILAAIGYNEWIPKIPGQKGLRILCLDGGGSRGMTSVVAMKCLVDSLGVEVADCFDLVVGTSTGAIIAFLVGLNLETSEQAVERYDVLIEKIFTKNAFSTPMLLFTTASYDESTFMDVLTDILGDKTMLDSRANPAVPLVFAVTSKMSSNPTHVALFRNYNYNGGELPDPFVIRPNDARESLKLPLSDEGKSIRMNSYPKKKGIAQPSPGTVTPDNGSRHPGSFRVLQKYALRASTAAPTVFKPVLMGGEMYCDGGIVASNPSAIAIHEARNVFPDVPIELVVSIGTGGFTELKSEPRVGWDGIIGQIINSATDAEQIHHVLEDVLGDGTTTQGKSSVSNTSYMRFNPTLGMPDEFPIDVTDPDKLEQIKKITRAYMKEPDQQRKLEILSDILKGQSSNISLR